MIHSSLYLRNKLELIILFALITILIGPLLQSAYAYDCVCNAGPDQRVMGGSTVTLDASRSSDPYRHPLTYEWRQSGGANGFTNTPSSDVVRLSDTHAIRPTFVAPLRATTLYFAVYVSDGGPCTGGPGFDVVAINVAAPASTPQVTYPIQNGFSPSAVTINNEQHALIPFNFNQPIRPNSIILGKTLFVEDTVTGREIFGDLKYSQYGVEFISRETVAELGCDSRLLVRLIGGTEKLPGVTSANGRALDGNYDNVDGGDYRRVSASICPE